MKVVIDANILCQDYWRKSTNFRVFVDGLPSVPGTVCIPEVVVDEVANRLREDIVDAIRSESEAIRDLARLMNRSFEPVSKSVDLEAEVALYRRELVKWVESVAGEILPYPDVPHQQVVQRDLRRRKPFKRDGSGYRDFLIWESVRRLMRFGHERVVFVTANVRDFGEGIELNADLKEDILNPHRLRLVPSLKQFNEEHILPRLVMLDDVRRALEENKAPELDVLGWVRTNLLDELRNYELGLVVAGFPDGVGHTYPSEISELRQVEVEEVRQLDSGKHLVRIGVTAEIVVSVHISWDDYIHHEEVREWAGPTDEEFSSSSSSHPEEFRLGIDLILDPEASEIDSQEITAIDASCGSIDLSDW